MAGLVGSRLPDSQGMKDDLTRPVVLVGCWSCPTKTPKLPVSIERAGRSVVTRLLEPLCVVAGVVGLSKSTTSTEGVPAAFSSDTVVRQQKGTFLFEYLLKFFRVPNEFHIFLGERSSGNAERIPLTLSVRRFPEFRLLKISFIVLFNAG